MKRITVTVGELLEYLVTRYGAGHYEYFICNAMRDLICKKDPTVRYFSMDYEERVLSQLGDFAGVKFENWYNGIDCTMSEGTMYGWYLTGHAYLESIGVTPYRERSPQYFMFLDDWGLKAGERVQPLYLDNFALSRIGILTEIFEERPNAAFIIEVNGAW